MYVKNGLSAEKKNKSILHFYENYDILYLKEETEC